MSSGKKKRAFFAFSTAFEAEFQRVYDVKLVGRLADVRQSFCAISVDRKLKHPAVIAVCDTARREFFR
jgi:LysR family transcriptional regulator, transcriptional activator of nhaA